MRIKTPAEIAYNVTEWYDQEADRFTRDQMRERIIIAINADRAQFFDTAGSASSQHYIDTGRYMLHEEVAEMERINGR